MYLTHHLRLSLTSNAYLAYDLKEALASANATEALVLIPLLAEAQQLRDKIKALLAAVQTPAE
jgi:hypothetical protein